VRPGGGQEKRERGHQDRGRRERGLGRRAPWREGEGEGEGRQRGRHKSTSVLVLGNSARERERRERESGGDGRKEEEALVCGARVTRRLTPICTSLEILWPHAVYISGLFRA
jgi:hypothetical protein